MAPPGRWRRRSAQRKHVTGVWRRPSGQRNGSSKGRDLAFDVAFADLKDDFVFRRIFATHPDILRGLLNDLLDRRDDETIVALEYLPSELLPVKPGAKSQLSWRSSQPAGSR